MLFIIICYVLCIYDNKRLCYLYDVFLFRKPWFFLIMSHLVFSYPRTWILCVPLSNPFSVSAKHLFMLLSPLCQQCCWVPPFPFIRKSILPLLDHKLKQPELWGSQLILHKSYILLIMQFEKQNMESHQTSAGNEKSKTKHFFPFSPPTPQTNKPATKQTRQKNPKQQTC